MKKKKMSPKYTEEINRLAEDHLEALLAYYLDAFHDGMVIGKSNALLMASIAAVLGGIGLCAAGIAYLEHKEQS